MIEDFGWSDALARAFAPYAAQGLHPARVAAQHRSQFGLVTETGEATGVLAGRFLHTASPGDHPVAGDWVAAAPSAGEGPWPVHAVLPRRGVFTRRAAGGEATQVVAAHVDLALLVSSLNADFNLRRLERYLAVALEGGAEPLIVLTKADLCADPAPFLVQARALGAEALAVSAVTGAGMDALAACLLPRRTAALLGSSGVGKSSLVNALAGDARMATAAIREGDDRGRHTTTHRELIRLPTGALLLDAPGMRELGLVNAETGVAAAFQDIAALAAACRFRDCSHAREPGCAVQAALVVGALDPLRWRSWEKLKREAAYEARQEDARLEAAHRDLWKSRAKAHRARQKARRREEE